MVLASLEISLYFVVADILAFSLQKLSLQDFPLHIGSPGPGGTAGIGTVRGDAFVGSRHTAQRLAWRLGAGAGVGR